MICILLQHWLIIYHMKFTNIIWHFCNILLLYTCCPPFIKVIFGLGYSGLLGSYPQVGRCVPCTPFCASMEPPFAFIFYWVPTSALAFYVWMVVGLGWCEGGGGVDGVWSPPCALTWICSARHRLPTVSTARWSDALSPWIPGCTYVWPAPTLWQSFSWRNRTSVSRFAAPLWPGGWLSSSG